MNPTMPTLARLFLAFALLLGAALGVMAEDLPEDTDKITSLTVEEAKRLVETFPGVEAVAEIKGRGKGSFSGCLPLNGVQSLDAQTAGVLAKYNKGPLLLNGLTALSPEAARALAEFKGLELSLNGLATLDADTVKAIAKFNGTVRLRRTVEESFFRKNPLSPETALAWADLNGGELNSITAFDSPDSVAVAKALATREGPLALRNLRKISPKTLSALIEKRDVELPLIELLELIPEPDGNLTDDFVIPEWLLEPQKQQRQQQAK